MSSDVPETTTGRTPVSSVLADDAEPRADNCWAVECTTLDDEPVVLLACDSEAEAIEDWLVGEYTLGFVTTIYRPELATHG